VASRAISVRLDDESSRALDELTRGGRDRSEVVRKALIDAAAARGSASIAAEAAVLASDADDRAEKAEVGALMEDLRAAVR
jgi:Arc/MetJ-type ribon-helix-helix transcriptional regulator